MIISVASCFKYNQSIYRGSFSDVLLPGKPHRQRNLVGYSPWGRKELDTTEWLHFTFPMEIITTHLNTLPVAGTSQVLCHSKSLQSLEAGFIILLFKVSKPKLRKFKYYSQGQAVNKWSSENSSLVWLQSLVHYKHPQVEIKYPSPENLDWKITWD